MIYVLLILLILFALYFFPLKVRLSYINGLEGNIHDESSIKKYSSLEIKTIILNIIPFIKYKKDSKADDKFKNKKNSNYSHVLNFIYSAFMEALGYSKIRKSLLTTDELKRIQDNTYFDKFNLKIGLDTTNFLYNCYLCTGISTLLNIYVGNNLKSFNNHDTKYLVNISQSPNKIYDINLDGIIKIKLVNTIHIFIKIIYRYLKIKIMKNKEEK